MNIKEAVEYCKSHNARIHTPTRETYDRLMEYLEEQGYRWISGKVPTDVYGCYTGYSCTVSIGNSGIDTWSLSTAKEYGAEILEITEDTFAEKLEKFIAGDIVFHVDSWELCKELAKVFDAKGLRGWNDDRKPLMVLKDAWSIFKGDSWYIGYYTCLDYEDIEGREGITEVTLKEVQEYLKSTKVIGGFFGPQKVTMRTPEATLEFQANVTQTTNGLLIEKLVEPKFSVGDKVYTATAKVGTIVSVGKHPSDSSKVVYGITWVNGKSAIGILEKHLTKLEELL